MQNQKKQQNAPKKCNDDEDDPTFINKLLEKLVLERDVNYIAIDEEVAFLVP